MARRSIHRGDKSTRTHLHSLLDNFASEHGMRELCVSFPTTRATGGHGPVKI